MSESGAAGLTWGIKYTFLKYVARMPDGKVELSDGASKTPGGEFFFPLLSEEGGVSKFGGSVVFTAHHGAMTFAVRNLLIQGDLLSVDGVPLATIEWGEPGVSQRVKLTAEGSKLFNTAYPEGELLDAVKVARASA